MCGRNTITRNTPRPGIARFSRVANTSASSIEIGMPIPAMSTLCHTERQNRPSVKIVA